MKYVIAFLLVVVSASSMAVVNCFGIRSSATNGNPKDLWMVCFTALETNSEISVNVNNTPLSPYLRYSRDGRTDWKSISFHSTSFYKPVVLTNIGDRVYVRAFQNNYGNYPHQFMYQTKYAYIETHGKVAASGDATSLISPVPLNRLPEDGCLGRSFCGSVGLASAPDLPSRIITPKCYDFMFSGCTQLTNMPALPAKIVYEYSYRCMFQNCSSLEHVEPISAGAIYGNGCYAMFNKSGIRVTPRIDNLSHVFSSGCYNMFARCSKLEEATYIPKCTVDSSGMYGMFLSCPVLDYVGTGMENFSYTTNWLSGVSATGTFRCPLSLKTKLDDGTISRSSSTVPSGWNVEAFTEQQ